ncbi:hypothetical protein M0R45_034287 [Rubus argutus]|uniref:CAAX prenyl protease 1 N-terminal domain-containing protein n=1 Tax=Rubus argutus TaxID=59490 RepID=A0AAW1VQP4_RUBAR
MAFPFLEAVIGFMILNQEKFEKSRAYCLEKSNFHFVRDFVTILTDSAILFFRVLPWFWKKSGDFVVFSWPQC